LRSGGAVPVGLERFGTFLFQLLFVFAQHMIQHRGGSAPFQPLHIILLVGLLFPQLVHLIAQLPELRVQLCQHLVQLCLALHFLPQRIQTCITLFHPCQLPGSASIIHLSK